jgi:hypothetical protein
VSAHDLNHESTLVGEGGIEYVVDSITDAGQGRVASDGGVCARHIIVNGTHQADNVQHLVRFDLLCGQLTRGDEVRQQAGPFCPENIGTSQTAVTTTHHEGINTPQHHVLCSLHTASALPEAHAPSRADQGTTPGQPATDILPVQLADHVAAVDQSLVSFENSVGFTVAVDCHTDNGPHSTVHTGGIST